MRKASFALQAWTKHPPKTRKIQLLSTRGGATVVFSQVAGLIARRIVCYKQVGDVVTAGERIGLIKFGSRVDVFFGPEWAPEVTTGQRVSAGSSVLARRIENGAAS
jgi:phosphatidylserine decarboxylase